MSIPLDFPVDQPGWFFAPAKDYAQAQRFLIEFAEMGARWVVDIPYNGGEGYLIYRPFDDIGGIGEGRL